jgi:mono/diheme cytochrome c family protein
MTVCNATRSILLAAGCLLVGGNVFAQAPNLKVPLDGPSIYKAYCRACHGADGKGHGPAAETLKYKVTDLTVIAKSNKGVFPRTAIEELLQHGDKWKSHGTKEMPIWGPIFLAVDLNDKIAYAHVHNLITYLESIQVK